jgi:hypothetical protein
MPVADARLALFPTGLPSLERILSGTTRGDGEEAEAAEDANRVGEDINGEELK